MLHKQNKKALSEIVGYTILIVIAISLSIMVYSFLKLYIPKEKVSCEEDVRLVVQDYVCKGGWLNITIANKGLFKADAAYVRFEDRDKGFKNQTNPNDFLLYNPDQTLGLDPGQKYDSSYELKKYGFPTINPNGNYSLELQPAIIGEVEGKKLPIVCENGIITQSIKCE